MPTTRKHVATEAASTRNVVNDANSGAKLAPQFAKVNIIKATKIAWRHEYQ